MEQAVPILPPDDLSVAKAFYVDGLGFSVTFEASEDGRTGLLGLERGTIARGVARLQCCHARQKLIRRDDVL